MPPTQTEKQREAAFLAAGLSPQEQAKVVSGGAITSTDFRPVSESRVTPFTPPQVPDITGLPKAETTRADEADPLGELEDLEQRISGFDVEGGIRTRTTDQQRALNEVNKRIGLLQARTEREAAKASEMGETLGFARGEESLVRREAAFEALELSALAQAAQGELLLARDLAKDAVKTQFEQLEKEARTKRHNILDNFDEMTPEQKRRAKETLKRLDAQDEFLKEEKARREKIQDIALDFVSKGGSIAKAEEIRKAPDAVTAQALAQQAMPAPTLGAKPLSITDIERYNDIYPEAGVTAGDTQATANAKVSALNQPARQEDMQALKTEFPNDIAEIDEAIAQGYSAEEIRSFLVEPDTKTEKSGGIFGYIKRFFGGE